MQEAKNDFLPKQSEFTIDSKYGITTLSGHIMHRSPDLVRAVNKYNEDSDEWRQAWISNLDWRHRQSRAPNLFAYTYRTTDLSFDRLLTERPDVTIEETIFRQRGFRALSQTVYFSLLENTTSDQKTRKVADLALETPAVGIDELTIHPVDEYIYLGWNTLLAFKLVDPFTENKLESTEALEKIAESLGVKFSYFGLSLGLNKLVSKNNVRFLIDSGRVDLNGIHEFYKSAVRWQFMALEGSSKSTDLGIKPMGLMPREPEDFCHPEYLPILADAHLQTIVKSVESLRVGREYSLSDANLIMKKFFEYANNSLSCYLIDELGITGEKDYNLADLYKMAKEKGVDVSTLDEIVSALNLSAESYQSLIKKYNDDPGLINKRTPKIVSLGEYLEGQYFETLGALPSYRALRNKILEFGGRGPKKPLYYRMRHAAHVGQI